MYILTKPITTPSSTYKTTTIPSFLITINTNKPTTQYTFVSDMHSSDSMVCIAILSDYHYQTLLYPLLQMCTSFVRTKSIEAMSDYSIIRWPRTWFSLVQQLFFLISSLIELCSIVYKIYDVHIRHHSAARGAHKNYY